MFTLFDGSGALLDALFASDDPAGTSTAAQTELAAERVALVNQWSPVLPSYPDSVFRMHAADDLNATGTTVIGNSMQRRDNVDDNDKTDWTTGAGSPSTFGLLNAGQVPF